MRIKEQTPERHMLKKRKVRLHIHLVNIHSIMNLIERTRDKIKELLTRAPINVTWIYIGIEKYGFMYVFVDVSSCRFS